MAKSDQVPVESAFGARSTAAEVVADIDLTGKTAIVTGGYSGLGLETVRALAGKGVKVVVPVRTPEKAEAALADIAGDVVALPMDLSDIKTIALFANALSRRLRVTDGLAFAVHPGGIFTPLQRHLPKEEMIAMGWLGEDGEPSELAKQGFKSPEQGASTSLWAATSPLLDVFAGVYCEDCNVSAPTDPDSPTARFFGVDDHATDDEAAERLWSVSEDLLNAA